jgi:pilus assembly protein CpaE
MSLQHMESVREKVKVVVNRVGLESGQISLKKARETIGREVFFQIPNDYRTMVEMRNNGQPLKEQAPKAAITLAVQQLTDLLAGAEIAPKQEFEKGTDRSTANNWLSFWPGKAGQKAKVK